MMTLQITKLSKAFKNPVKPQILEGKNKDTNNAFSISHFAKQHHSKVTRTNKTSLKMKKKKSQWLTFPSFF